MNNERRANNDRALIRVIKFSGALALGSMAAFLYSLKQVSTDLKWEISFGSGVSFAAGVALSWAFWQIVFGEASGSDDHSSKRRKRWFAVLSVLLALATLAPFAYTLNDIPRNKAVEVVEGAAIAIAALSVLGLLFWRLARFLEADSKKTGGDQDSSKLR
jgi:hypothetical protein